jgi:acetolactate synthase-1/2/3 large subunit
LLERPAPTVLNSLRGQTGGKNMTGAEALVRSLLSSGIGVCFANPGTSEMHFVAALDRHPEMRCVLCLFEGGASGAADGFARMTGRPAATLLHLAPGFGNAYANLHNARKAKSPVVNVVGDHAGYHLRFDAPLKGDLQGVAASVSHWVRRSGTPAAVGPDAAAAVAAALSEGGQIATLILPADASWGDGGAPARAAAPPALTRPADADIAAAARRLAGPGAALLVNGPGLYGPLAETAGRIAAATGCRLIAPFFAPRLRLGAGAVAFERARYNLAENAAFYQGIEALVLVGERRPVNFFAYPGKPSTPEAPGCAIFDLCPPEWDVAHTLDRLAAATGAAGHAAPRHPLSLPARPVGAITHASIGAAVASTLPEDAIVVNEAVTSAFGITPALATARGHDLVATSGGSIGQCLPAAVGAAIACPGRRVLALSGDGSGMYTLQSLWTMARERLDVTVAVFANRGYQILRSELANMGINDYGANAQAMFDVVNPELDWVALARGHGVGGIRVDSAEGLTDALERSHATPGPSLIEVAC